MVLYGITILTSAFLLFLVQPIIAKQILPWFGGSAAVWTVCVVFFQAVLLGGYAYAHALTRRPPRAQSLTHGVLLLVSLASLPIVTSAAWKPLAEADPTWRIAGLLTATIGLPYFLLSSTGPLLQKWFAEDRSTNAKPASVYRLFALSNAGSLVGLLCYPFVIEPYASLKGQAWGWSVGYACFAAACAACAWRVRDRAAPTASNRDAAGTPPTAGRYVYWLSCAALGSMLLLAVTNHITQNVASIPFLWVLPLTLYLLSFVVVFEGRGGRGWYVRRWWLAPVLAVIIAMTWSLSFNKGVLNLYAALPLFGIGLFLACVFCHGELAATKPAPAYLTQFYLSLSAGGAIGGLFVALVAPKLFANYWETPIALFGLCVIAALATRNTWSVLQAGLGLVAAALTVLAAAGFQVQSIRDLLPGPTSPWVTGALIALAATLFAIATWRRWTSALVVAALVCTGFYGLRYYHYLSDETLHASRNFYGALRVKEGGTGIYRRRDLLHGVILHGNQFPAEERRRQPTSYYGPESGVGLTLIHLRPAGSPLDVAMIGLGVGTLTSWGRPGDRYRIYELNPAVPEIAKSEFTYLTDSRAAVTIALGDARLTMENERADPQAPRFDVIAVDAFSSDSIPVHLITREALAVYMSRLKPDGVVAFHVSNRFLNLAPVVGQLADDAGLISFDVIHEATDDMHASSEWVLATRNKDFVDSEAIVKRITPITPIDGLPIWADQFNNLFKIIR